MKADQSNLGKRMRIAILGWGSLLWNPGNLAFIGEWQPGGPLLPIEFSRKSSDGRLTLVIDPQNGGSVPTWYAVSSFDNLDKAIDNLREREKTARRLIGFSDWANGAGNGQQRNPVIFQQIENWAKESGFDSVIWTDLPSNFEDFSISGAVTYLQSLSPVQAAVAREYIIKAPKEVDTPLHRELERIGWID